MELTKEEKMRYSRQTAIESFGVEAQMKLKGAKVFIVGCGALGSMAAMELAGAGVGRLGIADFDTIDISNLQRQFFFSTSEAGRLKGEVVRDRILALNPLVEVELISGMVNKTTASERFAECDFVIDATDNPASKIMTETVAEECEVACCVAGVSEFHGQLMTILPGGIKFSDIFGATADGGFTPCSIGGVAGPAAAVCASLQAAEAIKYITGIGDMLIGKLLRFDLLTNDFTVYKLS